MQKLNIPIRLELLEEAMMYDVLFIFGATFAAMIAPLILCFVLRRKKSEGVDENR